MRSHRRSESASTAHGLAPIAVSPISFFPSIPENITFARVGSRPRKFISSQYSLTTFFAQSGKVYFFEIEPRVEAARSGGGAWRKDLAPVNSDKAEYLIAQSSLSVSHPKRNRL